MCIARKILNWYKPTDRGLPWRMTTDPYAIWVSEIMLQQTRTNAVIPYYERFMESFPTPETLAQATEDALLKHWQGLGYYRRAKHLKQAAQIVSREGMPRDFSSLKALPGIGDYTAAAIASIAYGEPVAAVDGNLLRIYSRLYSIDDAIDKAAGKRRIVELANRDISADRPGDFNQAMMDLGNKICTPSSPRCEACPLLSSCDAHTRGRVDDYPKKRPKKKQQEEDYTVLLLDLEGRFLIEKRREGLLSSMWGFPMIRGHVKEEDILKHLAEENLMVHCVEIKTDYRHVFSHKIWNVRVYYGRIAAAFSGEDVRTWAAPKELKEIYAVPSAFQPALEVIYALD
ncbi:MAG: A/G-specific adenine glycosylase [Peptoniphilus sp.]|nr:A/G-specific adenine glycosylase [Peptoniphilus sp.]MDY3118322.1 A/G-specific adenine glycosylase [Peptoniphilus sp.]